MKNKRFTEIYVQYRKLVMKVAYDCLKDTFLAEEISQQVFTAFYEHMDSLRDESIKAWLMITTKNTIVDCVRKQRIRREKAVCLEAERCVMEDDDFFVEHIENGRLTLQILADLQERNQSWYEVVMDICVNEMSQREAAEHLGLTQQVLNAKLYRAKQYIRQKYQNDYEGK